MIRDPRHDILFDPVPIGPKTMRNRFYQAPHCTSFGADRPGAQAHIRAMKAEGGWAAVNTEFCSVHPSADSLPLISARLWDEDDARNLGAMAELAHEHGALAGVELWHGGCVAGNLETRLPARSVSQLTDDSLYSTSCYELDKRGIREIQGHYVAAAKRAEAVGFDIVNVHGAECGAITQHFLMAKYNRRTDEYGGSLENRARFWIETIEQVQGSGRGRLLDHRAALHRHPQRQPPRHPGGGGGLSASSSSPIISSISGTSRPGPTSRRNGPARTSSPPASRVSSPIASTSRRCGARPASRSRRSAASPTPTRWPRPSAPGVIDIIAAARPSIADPFLPRKIEEGRYDEIRECIGCNVCASRFPHGDADRLHPERDARRGVPPRLAPGEVLEGGERREDGARRRRRPGRDGVRHGARQTRPQRRPPGR